MYAGAITRAVRPCQEDSKNMIAVKSLPPEIPDWSEAH